MQLGSTLDDALGERAHRPAIRTLPRSSRSLLLVGTTTTVLPLLPLLSLATTAEVLLLHVCWLPTSTPPARRGVRQGGAALGAGPAAQRRRSARGAGTARQPRRLQVSTPVCLFGVVLRQHPATISSLLARCGQLADGPGAACASLVGGGFLLCRLWPAGSWCPCASTPTATFRTPASRRRCAWPSSSGWAAWRARRRRQRRRRRRQAAQQGTGAKHRQRLRRRRRQQKWIRCGASCPRIAVPMHGRWCCRCGRERRKGCARRHRVRFLCAWARGGVVCAGQGGHCCVLPARGHAAPGGARGEGRGVGARGGARAQVRTTLAAGVSN